MRTLELLASDSSHLPLLYVFKESRVMEKYGFELELLVVGSPKAPTMAHRAKLALAGEIDFLSGLHHETYRARAGEKRLTYLGQAQNNWDDRLLADPTIDTVQDLKGKRIICHSKAPCVVGNLRAVLRECGFTEQQLNTETVQVPAGQHLQIIDRVVSGEATAALVDMPFDLYGIEKGLNNSRAPRSASDSQHDTACQHGLHQSQ